MRILRDFYLGLGPRDRAVVWVAIALALAIGFVASALVPGRAHELGSPRFTAPPTWLQFAAAA
nr:hypothetical protein [uncultured Bradyrhizobium sp.]